MSRYTVVLPVRSTTSPLVLASTSVKLTTSTGIVGAGVGDELGVLVLGGMLGIWLGSIVLGDWLGDELGLLVLGGSLGVWLG